MTASSVIVDTSFMVALIDSEDTWHRTASLLADSLIGAKMEFIYFDCVINETFSVLCRRLIERKLERDVRSTLSRLEERIDKDSITWIYPAVMRYYDDCVDIIKTSAGRLNFHDALISVAARDTGLRFIGSFDRDFDEIDWLHRLARPEDIARF